ncbi:MAG TPA: type II toxin-antitoxin system RelE/ParE family toxin [Lacipirellulaceae bacterium]
MTLPVILRPEAEADVREIYQYLDEVRIGLGEQFSSRLREVLQQIESMPEIFGVVWRDVRAVRLRKFQYVVYYVVFTERVEVLAVMHGARHESSWQSRA